MTGQPGSFQSTDDTQATGHTQATNSVQNASLEYPIDSMRLIHKALKCEAARVEEMVRLLDEGDSLQPVRCAFNQWASALAFHAQQEDGHMTGLMPDYQPARENEAEHAALEPILVDITGMLDTHDNRGLADRVKALVAALHEEQHLQLFEKLEDVMAVLNEEIGRTKVVARTHRHLYQSVVALRVTQDDHLECEEEFVLPEIRQTFTNPEQLAMVRALLIDEVAEDQRWVVDWVAQYLTPEERQVLAGLEEEFSVAGVLAD